jgi:alpha-1,2-mannosyltransferase
MWNEHFGMNVVEFQAAGVIPIAHRSGGPLHDIVIEYNHGNTGYLATTVEEYASCIYKILDDEKYTGSDEMEAMRQRARQRSQEFSDEGFSKHVTELLQQPLLTMIDTVNKQTVEDNRNEVNGQA